MVASPDAANGEVSLRDPEVLPDGRAVLFTVNTGSQINTRIDGVSLDTGDRKMIVDAGYHPRHTRTGHLVYTSSDKALWGVAFDASRLETVGSPVPLVDTTRLAAVGFSGVLAYQPGTESPARRLVWVHRDGTEEAVDAPDLAYSQVRVSPDGARVAMTVETPNGASDLYRLDVGEATPTQLTFHNGIDRHPVWTPTGDILFSSRRDGPENIYRISADGAELAERIGETDNYQAPFGGLVPGTGELLFWEMRPSPLTDQVTGDIGLMPLEEGAEVDWLLESASFNEERPSLSPNGRWLVYQSDESGRVEVFVSSFPDVQARKEKISGAGGGVSPVWSHDGGEVFYRRGDGVMMAVSVQTEPTLRARGARGAVRGPVGHQRIPWFGTHVGPSSN